MLYVIRYVMRDGAETRVTEVYPRHREYLDRVAADGKVVAIGPLLPRPEQRIYGRFPRCRIRGGICAR